MFTANRSSASRRLAGCVVILALAMLASLPALAGEFKLAVAANFTDATNELVEHFEQASGHTVKTSFGSTGALYAQIDHGAPFDVFLAADRLRPERAEQEGLAVAGSRFTYARGRLALWSRSSDTFDDGPAYLEQQVFRHLAIANPSLAP
ncbi:MAG TPA: molybdate ABC transporter substrate-binding protein, partial [Wenzhouxiangella sp.]|nr:molybdate ABC transporter substrate-binding protein [Wenzhouxiangella sp.]